MIRYENGHLFQSDTCCADSFVVENEKFIFVGTASDAKAAYPDADVIDLNGRFVCPGFNDSHMHLLNLGSMLLQAQLTPHTDSLSHVLLALKEFIAAHPHEDFILGRGWNQDDFTDVHRYPNRDDLDAICPDKPMMITRACGHVAVANSAALRLCGIDERAPVVDGGRVVVDDCGRPNGVLEENAMVLLSSRIPAPDRAGIKLRLQLAMAHVNRYGITSVHSDDFFSSEAPFEEVIAAYLELVQEGKMTVRVTQQCQLLTVEELDRFLAMGYHTGWGNEWFRIGPLKIISDGSLGSRTALLHAPYSDAPDTCGIATHTKEELEALILRAHSAGMQIAAHAIGDAAADLVLNAIERAQALCPQSNMRHGIVHAQILNKAQAARMGKLGMHAYLQPIFLDYDTTIVYARVGQRAEEAYLSASFRENGVTISGGSDSPVEPPDVLTGVQCAVTRMPVTRNIDAPYLPHEALSIENAIDAFTAGGAYASFEENAKGKILPGMLADFVILAENPTDVSPHRIHQIPVCETYIEGTQVFARHI